MKTKGIAEWAFINSLDKKYEQWRITVKLTKEEAQKLKNVGIKVKETVDDNDQIIRSYKFTRKLKRAKGGGVNPQPMCVDPAKNKFDGIIGNGSEVIVLHKPYKWDNKFGSGIGTDLVGVQIVNLIPYENQETVGGKSLDDGDSSFDVIGESLADTDKEFDEIFEDEEKPKKSKDDF